MPTIVSIQQGGTGANNATDALAALGVIGNTGGEFTGEVQFTGPNNSINVANNALISGQLVVDERGLFGNGIVDYLSSQNIDSTSISVGGLIDNNGAGEIMAINKSNGALAYAEFIAINNQGDQDQGWVSVGVNSSEYNDPSYTLTGPDDGYLLYEAPVGSNGRGDLIIGTGSNGQNNHIVLAAGGFAPTDAQMIISPADVKEAEIVNSELISNVAILTTSTTHTFLANDQVEIASVGAPYDGVFTITAVTSNTFNVAIANTNTGSAAANGTATQILPFNKGTVQLTAQLFVGENSKSTIETADITLAQGHAIPLGIVVDNDGPGQTVMFNKSNGTLAYSEYIAHNDAGNVEMGWISMGINSSGYDDPEYPITKADDGYLLYEPPAGTTGDGDLIIGTGTNGTKNRLIFAAEGFDEANAQLIITPNESVRIAINTDSSSANTGALQVAGGIGVSGSVFVQGNQTIQGDLIVNGTQTIQSIDSVAASGPISLVGDGNAANTWDFGIVGTYAVNKIGVTLSITNKALANNEATLTTSINHGFAVEDYAVVTDVDSTFNGTHRITSVTANTFSYYKLANNISSTAATGNVTVSTSARYTGAIKDTSNAIWKLVSNIETRPDFNINFANTALDSLRVATINADNFVTAAGVNIGNIAANAVLRTGDTMTGTLNVSNATAFITTGNVGIGTTSPGFKLDVYNPNLGTSIDDVKEHVRLWTVAGTNNDYLNFFKLRNGAGSDWTNAGWRIQQKVDSTWMGWIQFNGDTNAGGISFGTGENVTSPRSVTEHMRISPTGNVGIGTITTSKKLHVECSTINDGLVVTGSQRREIIFKSTNEHTNLFLDSGHENLYFPTIRLQRSGNTFASIGLNRASNSDALGNYTESELLIETKAATPVSFATDNVRRLVVTSTGNVAIGTLSSASKFYIFDSGSTTNSPAIAQRIFYSSSGTPAIGLGSVIAVYTPNTSAPSGPQTRIEFGGIAESVTDGAEKTAFVINTPSAAGSGTVTERLRVMSDGNVGIGISEASAKLHVVGGAIIAGTNPGIGVTTPGYGGLVIGFDGDPNLCQIVAQNASSAQMAFYTKSGSSVAPEERLRITTTGNVGIGTTTPAVKFHVVGASIIANNTAIDPDSYASQTVAGAIADGSGWGVTSAIGGNAGTGDSWAIGHNGNGLFMGMQNGSAADTMQTYIQFDPNRNLYLVPTSGNIGVGTNVPGAKLDVNGFIRARTGFQLNDGTSTGGGLFLHKTITGSGSLLDTVVFAEGSAGTGNVHFMTAGSTTTKFYVGHNGNVGVGTSSPTAKLDVTGDLKIRTGMTMIANESNLYATDGTLSYYLATNGVYLNGAGLNGWLRLNGSGAENYRNCIDIYGSAQDRILFRTANADRMNINSAGNIGIGTVSNEIAKVQINEGGITAAAISTGWPAFNAETAAQSKYLLDLQAGGNGSVGTGGTGASVTLLMGGYFDARGIITMRGAGGASPSDQGQGYGKDLMVKAGNSDNGNGLVGGRLFLAGGSGYSGGAFGTNYGSIIMQSQGGNVCIGTTAIISSYAHLHIRGSQKGVAIQNSDTGYYRAIYVSSNNLYFYNGTNEGYLNDSGAWINASDIRIKKDITEIKYGLNTVLNAQPRSYRMIDSDKECIGFVAQEMLDVVPEVVSGDLNDPDRKLGLDYGSLVAVAFKAIQELKAELDAAKLRITELENK